VTRKNLWSRPIHQPRIRIASPNLYSLTLSLSWRSQRCLNIWPLRDLSRIRSRGLKSPHARVSNRSIRRRAFTRIPISYLITISCWQVALIWERTRISKYMGHLHRSKILAMGKYAPVAKECLLLTWLSSEKMSLAFGQV
jgi:hypothetical protein